jgi:hypothetical protein
VARQNIIVIISITVALHQLICPTLSYSIAGDLLSGLYRIIGIFTGCRNDARELAEIN